MAGPGLRKLESGMTSLPIVGDMIGNARRGSIEGLNLAIPNRALAPIGESLPADIEPGREAIAKAGDILSDRYTKLLPKLKIAPDPQFQTEVAQITAPGGDLTDQHAKLVDGLVQRLITSRIDPATGAMSGDAMKEAETRIGQRIAKYRQAGQSNVADSDMADALTSLRSSLRDMVIRSNPQASEELKKLNEGWANLAIAEDAASRLGAHEGLVTPGQLAGAVRGANDTVRKRGYARGEALMQDLSDAALARLPSTVPDSGSPYRHALEATVAGLVGKEAGVGGAVGKAGIAAAILGAPYTKLGRPAVQTAMTQRPAFAKDIAQFLETIRPLIGYGAATAAPITLNLPSLESAP